MAINWFPGHMHRARKKIKEAIHEVDLIVEIMDARIPYSSENPLVTQLRQDRPCLRLLNKSDLADESVTNEWLAYIEKEKGVKALAISTQQPSQVKQIPALCRKLVPHRNSSVKPVRVMIMGIPNVGKSTLINKLAGRTIAKVGNEPAVTKNQQTIKLSNDIILCDTPGFLWPKFEDQNCGYRLAVTGAIKNTAIEFEDVALFAAGHMLATYPDALITRYKFKTLPETDIQLLEEIGRKRGGLRAGGLIDMHKASEVLLHDIRNGTLGRISMETPTDIPVIEEVTDQSDKGDE